GALGGGVGSVLRGREAGPPAGAPARPVPGAGGRTQPGRAALGSGGAGRRGRVGATASLRPPLRERTVPRALHDVGEPARRVAPRRRRGSRLFEARGRSAAPDAPRRAPPPDALPPR